MPKYISATQATPFKSRLTTLQQLASNDKNDWTAAKTLELMTIL